MNQDLAFDKRDPNHYWEAMNMELINNGTSLSMVTSSGTETKIDFGTVAENLSDAGSYSITYQLQNYTFARSTTTIDPSIVNHTQFSIIGMTTLRDDLYIFTQTEYNLNIIFRYSLEGGGLVVPVYAGYLDMTVDYPLEIIANYENDIVQKLYWVDGYNWYRILNVSRANAEELEIMPSTFIDIAVLATMESPTIAGQQAGGKLTAGRRQYGYTLYNRSGQQTTLSPLSEIYSIAETSLKGGETEEVLNIALTIDIQNLDTAFNSIRIYAIQYSTSGTSPAVSIILDESLTTDNFTFVDDGNLFVSDSSVEELIALNNSSYKGGTINTKKNIMFMGDYFYDLFDMEANGTTFDTRAYAHDSNGIAKIKDINNVEITVPADFLDVDPEHDAINADEDVYMFKQGTTRGGRGLYVSYSETSANQSSNAIASITGMKQGDRYRVGLLFRDGYNRTAPVLWMADHRVSYGSGMKHLNVYLNEAGVLEAQSRGAVGYSVVIVERNATDRDILAQGFIQPTFRVEDNSGPLLGDSAWRPYYVGKDITENGVGGNIAVTHTECVDFNENSNRTLLKSDKYCNFYSPDVTFTTTPDLAANSLNIIGFNILNPVTTVPSTTYVQTTYELWKLDSSEYGYGRTHPYDVDNTSGLVYYNTTLPSPCTSVNSPSSGNIFAVTSSGVTDVPRSFFESADTTSGNYSFDTFFWKSYGASNYLNYDVPQNVAFSEPTKLVEKNDNTDMDGGSTFRNHCHIYQMIYGSSSNYGSNNTVAADTVLMTFPNDTWHTDGTLPWDKFIDVTGQGDLRALPVGDLKVGVINQYGGNSFEARRRNTYISAGDLYEFDGAGGSYAYLTNADTFYRYSTMVRLSGENKIDSFGWHVYEYIRIPLETYIDPSNVSDESNSIFTTDGKPQMNNADARKITMSEFTKYNSAYSRLPNAITYATKPYNFQTIEKFDSNIIATGVKFNNEVIDSWTNFLPNEVMQLHSQHGKITKLQELKGELYAFQPRAIAAISILPRAQIQAADGVNLQLGTGAVLDDFNYVTTKSGSANKWSIYSMNDDIIYYDYHNKSIASVKEGSLSNKYNMDNLLKENYVDNSTYLIQDNPLLNAGVRTTYDPNNKSIYITMLGASPLTLSYNTMTQGFVSLHSFFPTIGIEYNGALLTTNVHSTLYEHLFRHDNVVDRTLYGSAFISYITILSSKDPLLSKMFTNVEYDVKGDNTFNKIEVWNDYQTTGEIPLTISRSGNMRYLYNKWRVKIGREENTRNTLVDTKAWVKLIFDPFYIGASRPSIDNITLNNIEIKYTR
jgi:hypothetical protein